MGTPTPNLASQRVGLKRLADHCKLCVSILRYLFRPHILVLIAGITLTLTTTHYYTSYKDTAVTKAFERKAMNISRAIEQKANHSIEVLSYLNALYYSIDQFSARQFNKYSHLVLARHPEIMALEWAPRISQAERKQFEKSMQEQHPGYQITQQLKSGVMGRATKRSYYYPVMMMEPYSGNEAALGFDLGSNQTRLQTMLDARDSNSIQATPQLSLVQDKKTTTGILVFLPIYQTEDIHTSKQRRDTLHGFLLAVYDIKNMITSATKIYDQEGLVLALLDRSDPKHINLLYSSIKAATNARDNPAAEKQLKTNQPYLSRTIPVAGRNWQLTISPAEGYYKTGFTWRSAFYSAPAYWYPFWLQAICYN